MSMPSQARIERRTSGSAAMLFSLFKRYPSRSLMVLIALLIASLLEGVGLSTILTMLSQASDPATSALSPSPSSAPEQWVASAFARFGIAFNLLNLLIATIILMLFKTALVLWANRLVGYAVAQVATDLRLDLLRAVVSSRWQYYLSKPIGSLANAMATEAQRASEGYLQGAVMATQIISAIVYSILALLISWQISLAALGLSLLLLVSLNLLVRIAGRAGQKQTGLLKSILTVMTDQLTAIKPLKAMAREDRMDAILTTQTQDLNQSLRKQVFSKEAMKALQEGLLVILAAVGLYVMMAVLDMPAGALMILILLLVRITGFLSKAQRAWQLTAISESAYWSLMSAIAEAERELEPRSVATSAN
ncbi:MAG: ABC transporter transmembrane domain-containing protein [Pseudomonadota bacterium]